MSPDAIETFEQNRSFLLALGTKIAGSHAEAEDLVNETFLRWERLDHAEIRNPRAMLATIVTRLAITHKQSARARREVLFDPGILWEMDHGLNSPKEDLSDALTAALEIVIGRLTPNERAVFLLREVFEFEYSQVAATLDESESNCRQLLRRAREKIGASQARRPVPSAHAELVLERFITASQSGDLEPLLATVCEEPVLIRDAGNLGLAVPEPLVGREALFHHFAAVWHRLGGIPFSIRSVGEKYELAEFRDAAGNLAGALIATLQNDRIQTIRQISCPAKLGFLNRILHLSHDEV